MTTHTPVRHGPLYYFIWAAIMIGWSIYIWVEGEIEFHLGIPILSPASHPYWFWSVLLVTLVFGFVYAWQGTVALLAQRRRSGEHREQDDLSK